MRGVVVIGNSASSLSLSLYKGQQRNINAYLTTESHYLRMNKNVYLHLYICLLLTLRVCCFFRFISKLHNIQLHTAYLVGTTGKQVV